MYLTIIYMEKNYSTVSMTPQLIGTDLSTKTEKKELAVHVGSWI